MMSICLRAGPALLALALALGVGAPVSAAQTVSAQHIKFVYPDSPEMSNAPYPPAQSRQAVRDELRSTTVVSGTRHMTLAQYLRDNGVSPSSVVAVKVQGNAAAIYVPRR
jgi:hypothetical protein